MPLVTIASYTLPQDLLVHRSVLEMEGIPCFVQNELTAQVHNFYSNAIGGVKLQVRSEDFQKAREILLTQTDFKIPYDDEKLICIHCGSSEIKGIGFKGKLSVWLLLLTGKIISVDASKMKCNECGESTLFRKYKSKVDYEKGEFLYNEKVK